MKPDFDAVEPARVEFVENRPFSPSYRDGYFGSEDGEGESAAVFLEGNQLARRFADLRSGDFFVIGETGFGTGLNVLQAARLFQRIAPEGARLYLLSAEKHPLTAGDLARALSAWPGLEPWSGALRAGYPPAAPGYHRIALAPRVELLLMLGDAGIMWGAQTTPVDAWFLDGFAPSRNPEMWTDSLIAKLAARSRPGTTLATFSVAARVRSALAAHGFETVRRAGFGAKRHRLEAHLPGRWAARSVRAGRVHIAGAGLAGATTARALAERGWDVEVFDPLGVAAGASGNRAGVLYTTPSGVATPQNRFYQSSYLRALQWISNYRGEALGLARMDGVVQHVTGERQRRKLESASRAGVWPAPLLEWLDESCVLLPAAGVLDPPGWCRHLLSHERIALRTERLPVSPEARGAVDATVWCTGSLEGHEAGLPIRRIRGQVTECRATPESRRWRRARCHSGYVTPAIGGTHSIGATFDLGETETGVRDGDDLRNLAELRRWLPRRWEELGGDGIEVTGRRVGFRCQSADFLPIAGPARSVAAGQGSVWFNVAHGSRGLSGTPLSAERIADELSGLPAGTDANILDAIGPDRFHRRQRNRSRR